MHCLIHLPLTVLKIHIKWCRQCGGPWKPWQWLFFALMYYLLFHLHGLCQRLIPLLSNYTYVYELLYSLIFFFFDQVNSSLLTPSDWTFNPICSFCRLAGKSHTKHQCGYTHIWQLCRLYELYHLIVMHTGIITLEYQKYLNSAFMVIHSHSNWQHEHIKWTGLVVVVVVVVRRVTLFLQVVVKQVGSTVEGDNTCRTEAQC